jgi:hypothetical protein
MCPPKGIFSQGFQARGTNTNILVHTDPAYGAYSLDSAYVSTSSSKRVAQAFALLYDDRIGFVYEVNKLNEGINIRKALKPYVKSGEMTMNDYNYYSLEREIAIPHKIEPQHIRGAWPVTEAIGIDTESYQKNPHYKEPAEIPAARFARAAGKVMTGVGLVIDGINLYDSYEESLVVGNYDPLFHETARVAGGWSGAYAAGSAAGFAGASACSSFGPQASLACGFVAGVYGSMNGYQAGSESVTKVLLFDIRRLRKGTILENMTEEEEIRYNPFNHY